MPMYPAQCPVYAHSVAPRQPYLYATAHTDRTQVCYRYQHASNDRLTILYGYQTLGSPETNRCPLCTVYACLNGMTYFLVLELAGWGDAPLRLGNCRFGVWLHHSDITSLSRYTHSLDHHILCMDSHSCNFNFICCCVFWLSFCNKKKLEYSSFPPTPPPRGFGI